MSDLATQRDLARRLEQTQVTERPGGVTGFDTFYATGTYVPTYTGNTTAGVTTYTLQVGSWVRVGALLVATGVVTWTAATGTGTANISLPFASQNVTNQFFSGGVRVDGVTFATGAPEVFVPVASAFFQLVAPVTNANATNIAIEAAGQIIFTISYFV